MKTKILSIVLIFCAFYCYAIDNALDDGRGGLGAIVVFASGNWSPAIDYPAYYRPEILVVVLLHQNVNVQNNAKLTIDVQNNATINGPFEVQIGSELEIK